jgi:hypothetical protein
MWQQVGNGSANLDLSEYVKEVLSWAEEKMHQERKLRDLMDRNPGLKDLHDKFEMMKILCQEASKQ